MMKTPAEQLKENAPQFHVQGDPRHQEFQTPSRTGVLVMKLKRSQCLVLMGTKRKLKVAVVYPQIGDRQAAPKIVGHAYKSNFPTYLSFARWLNRFALEYSLCQEN